VSSLQGKDHLLGSCRELKSRTSLLVKVVVAEELAKNCYGWDIETVQEPRERATFATDNSLPKD
jgi:hypothetical protein